MTTDGKVPGTQQCDLTMSNKETRSAAVAPSADQYAAALRRLSLSQTQIAMLTFHFNADERTVTATQMARAIGFTRYNTANAQYGRLGRLVGEQLDYNPMQERLGTLVTFEYRDGEWHWLMRPQLAAALQQLGVVQQSIPNLYPDEIPDDRPYTEGTRVTKTVNAYERDPHAREACIAHHGCRCAICGFDFGAQYGDIGVGIIHVHHLRQLSTIGHEYRLDPIHDLLPVCPNCHAVIHVGHEPLSPETLRENLAFTFGKGGLVRQGT